MAKHRVVTGNITDIPADAIITGIYPDSSWTQGVDGAIRRVAGSLFHDQAFLTKPLYEGEVVIARSNPLEAYGLNLRFRNVVFVVDAGQRPLSRIVYAGLNAAANEGFRDVTIPAIRLGVMLGAVEKTEWEVVSELIRGLNRFERDQHKGLDTITFVIHNNDHFEMLFKQRFIQD